MPVVIPEFRFKAALLTILYFSIFFPSTSNSLQSMACMDISSSCSKLPHLWVLVRPNPSFASHCVKKITNTPPRLPILLRRFDLGRENANGGESSDQCGGNLRLPSQGFLQSRSHPKRSLSFSRSLPTFAFTFILPFFPSTFTSLLLMNKYFR